MLAASITMAMTKANVYQTTWRYNPEESHLWLKFVAFA
jgi:hypothetical protein